MKVIILCGGKGIRAFPFNKYSPKPMLPLGGSPVVVQVIKSFIEQGFTEFILAAGHRQSVLIDYFEGKDIGATIDIVDTGEDTDTGGRILACQDLVGDSFMVTYADGLCDVPLSQLMSFHNNHGGLATITSVPMLSQYGVLTLKENGQVIQMREKPLIEDHWINAGFMVFDQSVFSHWNGNNLEKEVLPHLIEKDLAFAYRHNGFFKSVDNYKDVMEFEELMSNGNKPWAVKEACYEILE